MKDNTPLDSRSNTMIYNALNKAVLLKIPKDAQAILDIGCGSGTLGKEIKENINCEIVGVTYSPPEAEIASESLNRVIIADLNQFDTHKIGQFDCIICSHILEHLYKPEELLMQLHINLYSHSILIIALPNVLYWKQRIEFLKGKFKYTDFGLMDRTHVRFFDWQTAHKLLEENGYEIIESESDGNLPLPGIRKFLPSSLRVTIDRKAVQYFPGLFGYQFIFSCRSKLCQSIN